MDPGHARDSELAPTRAVSLSPAVEPLVAKILLEMKDLLTDNIIISHTADVFMCVCNAHMHSLHTLQGEHVVANYTLVLYRPTIG